MSERVTRVLGIFFCSNNPIGSVNQKFGKLNKKCDEDNAKYDFDVFPV